MIMRHGQRGVGLSPRHRRGAALLTAVFAGLAMSCAFASPYVPRHDDEVLEQLPEARDAGARDLRRLHAALAAEPGRLDLAVGVAQAELRLGHALADPRHLGRAEAALARWPDGPDTPREVLLLRATLRQALHDFTSARAELDQVLRADPRNVQARLTRASIFLVQADYKAAGADCGQLQLAAQALAGATCSATLASLTGHAAMAQAMLSLTLQASDGEAAPVRLWAWTVAAEIAAQRDDGEQARRAFAEALRVNAADPYLLGAYADFLLDAGEPRAVIDLLRDQTRIDPLLLRLALAEAAAGDPRADEHVAELKARFATSRMRGETVHRREEARFTLALLHDPVTALALAQANWQVQREPADARVLLEAARAAGDAAAAAPVMAWARDNAIEAPMLTRLIAALQT